ncbi:MAG: DNA-directed RNA polymerase subunit omega [Nitrospirae bacterium]|nr:DNA-directed RNA polymerase subunit omega [Nitrospirota bacterium]
MSQLDLISLPIPMDKTSIDSRFRLVILAGERARTLMMGAKPVIDVHSYKKESTIALYEIVTANVQYLTGKEARKELRKAKTARALEGAKSAAERAKEEEVKSELEKDLNVYLSESQASEKRAGQE